MGDRIVVLHEGYVRQVGSAREVYDDPADTFVATFLGSPPMNLVEQSTSEIGPLIAGFRPEHLRPRPLVEGPAVVLAVRITGLEYLGSERILYAQIERGRFAGQKLTAKLPATYALAAGEGDEVELAIAERDLRYFDQAGKKREPPGILEWE